MRLAWWKILVVAAVAASLGVVIYIKGDRSPNLSAQTAALSGDTASGTPTPAGVSGASQAVAPPRPLPRLVDLGAKKCVPCKMMAPILDELAKEYKGRLSVEFIDVWQNPGAGDKYGIQSIPTQVFYDASGKEFFRHEGFYPKEDILAKFREKGVRF